jgi:hypothetical protein
MCILHGDLYVCLKARLAGAEHDGGYLTISLYLDSGDDYTTRLVETHHMTHHIYGG